MKGAEKGEKGHNGTFEFQNPHKYAKFRIMKDKSIKDPFYLQIQREINRIERKQELNRALHYLMRIVQIVLTGGITYLAGIAQGKAPDNHLILLLGVLATSITAIETLFSFDSKKEVYTLLLFDLRAIRAEFIFHWMSRQADENVRQRLFEKYIAVSSNVRNMIVSNGDARKKNKDFNQQAQQEH